MIASVQPIGTGVAGVSHIVATANAIKDHYGRLPCIRAAAIDILRAARVGNDDQSAQVAALARFVRGAVCYVCDPINAEFIQTPDLLLLDIYRHGSTFGDCDDHCVLFASLCEAVGIPCAIVGVRGAGAAFPDHVIAIAQLDAGPLEFDLVAKGIDQPSYTEKLFPAT